MPTPTSAERATELPPLPEPWDYCYEWTPDQVDAAIDVAMQAALDGQEQAK